MDLDHIKGLVGLMVDNDLSRIEIREGETHILLRRGHGTVVSMTPAIPPPHAATAGPPAPAAPAAPLISVPAAPAGEANEILIRSPMVGTFYSAADPNSPKFVNVGDTVKADTIVCLIEAMKVFNEIKAEVSGRIVRVLVSNAQAVEYDQPLFAVVPG